MAQLKDSFDIESSQQTFDILYIYTVYTAVVLLKWFACFVDDNSN